MPRFPKFLQPTYKCPLEWTLEGGEMVEVYFPIRIPFTLSFTHYIYQGWNQRGREKYKIVYMREKKLEYMCQSIDTCNKLTHSIPLYN